MSDQIRCKGVHVKLDKMTHTSFRAELLQHGVTMQEAFETFAKLIGAGNLSAKRMLDNLVHEKVKQELATVGLTHTGKKRRPRYVGELDSETLYDLINEGDEPDEAV